jgi:spore germination protein GerM
MKGAARRRRGVGILVVAFIIFALFLGAMLLRKYEAGRVQPTVPPAVQTAGPVTVTLFFAANDGTGLVREGREIDACEEPVACLESVLEELINGPVGDLTPTLPPTGLFHSVQLAGDLARVDLARELVEALPGGSNSEQLAVYSIVNSLAFNFPQVKRVAITVAGQPTATLKGHLDLRQPLLPDYTLERRAGGGRNDEGVKR